MNKLKLIMCAGAASLGLAWAGSAAAQATAPAPAATPAAPAAPAANPMPYPAMTAPLSANPNPATFDAGPLGKIMVDGVLSGDLQYQSDPQNNFFGRATNEGYADISNAQVIINKTDGPVQFYIQAGAYSINTLGSTYYTTGQYDRMTYGFIPEGFVKLVPNANFNVMIGVLPTLIGAEYTFSFQNMNIERGLLWNQEPVFSKGIQVNFTQGPWALSGAWTDGYYSNDYTALSGAITYTFKSTDTLEFAASGNVSPTTRVSTFVTPPEQNNGQVYNLIFSHSQGPWTITPYLQYTNAPNVTGFAGRGPFFVDPVSVSGSTWGGAVLTKYNFTPTFSVAGRVEYISSSGKANLLGFGANSNAWSFTITPTYQKGIFFLRGEASYTDIGSGTAGDGFGRTGMTSSQVRVLGETGFIF